MSDLGFWAERANERERGAREAVSSISSFTKEVWCGIAALSDISQVTYGIHAVVEPDDTLGLRVFIQFFALMHSSRVSRENHTVCIEYIIYVLLVRA
jgi:hypothetical protein